MFRTIEYAGILGERRMPGSGRHLHARLHKLVWILFENPSKSRMDGPLSAGATHCDHGRDCFSKRTQQEVLNA